MDPLVIRREIPRDIPLIHGVNAAAFDTTAEARLVDALRAAGAATLSLVAEERGEIVGHILFSPVTIEGRPGLDVVGLAPMAVVPARQRQGIGSRLVREGLAELRQKGCVGVVVLGHPRYYPRFGFVPASRLGLRCEYDSPDEAFMALELVPGALAGPPGLVRYHPELSRL